MPIPKPKKPEDITIGGKHPKTLDIKVVKPARLGRPNLMKELLDLAKKKKMSE